jgi:segregation and condensation protein B
MFNADVPEEDIVGAIQRLDDKFQAEEFAFQLYKASGGYQFLTKPAYQASIGIMLKQQSKKRLSTSAMETLSIIAYKQPISKTEIENIRGVNCDYAVQKLLDKSLIEITGKADTIGRPMLYGTTSKFMEYFGINDLNELPVPKEAAAEVNTIGQNSDYPELSLQNAEVEELLADESIIEESPELHDEGHVAGEDMSLDQESTSSEEVTDSLAPELEEPEADAIASTEEGTGEPDIESPDHHPEEPEQESDAQT